jgi:inhibitor of KinA sporulation pathway (predicted exonuclease)
MKSTDLYLSLDLEMAQPSGKIIQIGACVGNIHTGEIVDTFSALVRIDEPLTDYIVNLTGITENALATEGTDLLDAYGRLLKWFNTHNPNPLVIQWGDGDMRVLREQIQQRDNNTHWPFGYRYIDAKTLFQVYQLARGQKLQAGLAKAMTKLGLSFKGRKHNGLDDAINTFHIAHHLIKRFSH